MVIGTERGVRLGEIDDAEGEIIGGEAREICQRRVRRAGELRAQLGIDRDSFEFPEVGVGEGPRKEAPGRRDE